MATQLVEIRPGKWVKVVDGHIVGRATPEEVAAWQQAGRAQAQAAPDLELDIDLAPKPAAGPAHVLDISPRPAFERRSRPATPAPEAAGSAGVAPARAAAPSPKGQAASKGKDAGATAPTGRATPPAQTTEPARRPRAATPPSQPAPAARQSEGAPDRGRTQGQALATPAATKGAARPPEAPPAPAASEPEPTPGRAVQGPSYWWIWNARSQPVAEFLAEWTARYRHKFGRQATLILCHADDLAAVEACGYNAEVSPLLQPGHFYLSHGEGQ